MRCMNFANSHFPRRIRKRERVHFLEGFPQIGWHTYATQRETVRAGKVRFNRPGVERVYRIALEEGLKRVLQPVGG